VKFDVRRSRLKSPLQPIEDVAFLRNNVRAMGRAWWSQWGEVVRRRALFPDLLAGLTVAAVALPLNLALAVACGLPPIAGLVAGAIGGALAAIFGGTPLQVSGPAAALQVMVLGVAIDFGPVGVAAATLMIGLLQLGLAFSGAGRFGKHFPESVLAGFTTGVGLKLLENQLPELLGFNYRVGDIVAMMHRPHWLHEVSWLSVVCALAVALLMVASSKYKRFPAALLGITVVTALAVYLDWPIERVGEVPSSFPAPTLPIVDDDKWLDLGVQAVLIGLVASVESLLSASVVDRMAPDQPRHQPNLELFGQGVANLGTGIFGGMPVTGVVVRSSVNVQSGGRSRWSALVHAVVLGGAVLMLSTQLAKVPLAGLAGLLCLIGFRLIEVSTLLHLLRDNKIEAAAFLVTAVGTVSGHLIAGLGLGLALHAINRLLHHHESAEQEQIAHERERGVRAVLTLREHGSARKPKHQEPTPRMHAWLQNVRQKAHMAKSAFVHEQATVIGRVVLGENVHIAAGSSVRADEGAPFFIGDDSNIQDGVVIHALKDKHVLVGGEPWAVYVGRNVSMAHDALVHGPCYVGDDTFIGFKAVVHDSVVGSHCFIGIGAVVVGVQIPDGKFVPHGRIVDSKETVAALPDVSSAQREFNEDVVEVNRGLAAAYHEDRRAPRPVRLHDPQPVLAGRTKRSYDDRF
jgi:SulP family sulfate permease